MVERPQRVLLGERQTGLAEDTGVSDHLPTGQGLVVLHDFNEAVADVGEIYERYSQAARRQDASSLFWA